MSGGISRAITQVSQSKQALMMAGGKGVREGVKLPLWRRAREYTEEALGVLIEVMRDEDAGPAIRAQCADKVLDRAWGKAPIIVAGDEERPITVDVRNMDSDRIAVLEQALMAALGEGITRAALPNLNGTLAGGPDGNAGLAGALVSDAIELAASDDPTGSLSHVAPANYPQGEEQTEGAMLTNHEQCLSHGLFSGATHGGEGDA